MNVRMPPWGMRLASTLMPLLLCCNQAWAQTTPLLDGVWSEARALAGEWTIGDARLQVRKGSDVYVANDRLVIVGSDFLEKTAAAPDAREMLLFALLHELWHVQQLMLDTSLHGTLERRPALECAADARAAFTLARQQLAGLDAQSSAAQTEQLASQLAAIQDIPTRFSSVDKNSAHSLKHLSVDQRRFAAQIGVLLALSVEAVRLPEGVPGGMYAQLLEQMNAVLNAVGTRESRTQENMDEMCAYIGGGGAGQQVRVSYQAMDILNIAGKNTVVTRHKIDNLLDKAVAYSFLLVDGVVMPGRSERDMRDFSGMRRKVVNVPAHGTAEFSTFSLGPVPDKGRFRQLPDYTFGTLDRVVVHGRAQSLPACFEVGAGPMLDLDAATKKAIRVGQAASGNFAAVRGAQNQDYSSASSTLYDYIFDEANARSGWIIYSSMLQTWSASLEIYRGEDKEEAMRLIDAVEAYAKRYCPQPTQSMLPLYWRDSREEALHIQRFTAHSTAVLSLTVERPDDDTEHRAISVAWEIRLDGPPSQ